MYKQAFWRKPVSIVECFAFCSETTSFLRGVRWTAVQTCLGLCPKPQQGTSSPAPPLRFAAVLRCIHNTASTKSGLSPPSLPPKSATHQSLAHAGDFTQFPIRQKNAPSLIERKRISFIFYSLINSYSRLPKPIFSAWSRQLRHSDSGVEFLNGSPQSAKPGFFKLSESWLFGIGFAARQASTHA